MTRGMGGHSVSNIAHCLKGITFPSDRKSIVEHARSQSAEQDVIDVLDGLPDQQYGNMADVMKGVGQSS